jgi:hypothetical protein
MLNRKCFFVALLVSIIIPFYVYAEETPSREYRETPTIPYGGPQYYVYLGANRELQIDVQVWGKIAKPGLYSVPKTTDIIGLISFAGGPADGADLKKVKIIRNNPKSQIIKVDLKKYLNSGDISKLPLLKPGDMIIIPESPSYTFFPKFLQFFSVASQTASIITAYVSMYYLIYKR